jgi:tetratricopeptide (TPR) repeat protein
MERTAHLSEQLGDWFEFFVALINLSFSCILSGELSRAGELAQRMLTLAGDDPTGLAWAHEAIGQVLRARGEFASSRKELEKAVAFAETTTFQLLSFGIRAWFLTHLAQTLWLLGYPGQAFDRIEQAKALAKNEPDFWCRGVCESWELHVRLLLRDQQTVDDATRLLTFATEHGLSHMILTARTCLGGALGQNGERAQGLAQIEPGLEEGVRMKEPPDRIIDALRAEAYAKVARFSDGLRLVAEALARSEQTGEAMLRAEFHRLKGELLLADSNTNVDEAERAFRIAIEVADQQAARSWEINLKVADVAIL